MPLNHLPADSRPREKLPAMPLRNSIAGKGVLQAADELLQFNRATYSGEPGCS